MNQQAIDNREWLMALLEKRGLLPGLMDKAAYVASALLPSRATWFDNYSRAYGDGHNNHGLRDRRLDHYASAYADICDEIDAVVPELQMTLEAFWLLWDVDTTFEGGQTEHWYFA